MAPEAMGEAIAHAWQRFVQLRMRRADKSAKTALRLACKTAVMRVRSRCRFVPKPYPGYIDALDRRSPTSVALDAVDGVSR